MRRQAIVLAAALALAPLGARAADLVVWWEKGFYPQEDEAVREIVAAFEQKTGKQVELVFYPNERAARRARGGGRGRAAARLRVRLPRVQPPFRVGLRGPARRPLGRDPGRSRACSTRTRSPSPRCSTRPPAGAPSTRCRWGSRPTMSTSGATCSSRPGSPSTTSPSSGRRSGRSGATRCSRRCAGRPAATTSTASAWPCRPRRATHRPVRAVHAGLRGQLRDPRRQARHRRPGDQTQADQGHGQLHRDLPQGLHAARLDRLGDEQQQQQPGVPGTGGRHDAERHRSRSRTRSRRERPEDYYKNTATIEWPDGADGQPLAIRPASMRPRRSRPAGMFRWPRSSCASWSSDGWLAHCLDFSGERLLPPMPKLLEQPFWLDPSDPHHMAAAIQFLTRPRDYKYCGRPPAIRDTCSCDGRTSGARPSTASPPRASAPSRRSTRRSRGSSRSWRSERTMAAARPRVLSRRDVLVMAPLGARAADLVVWWEKGFYAQEDEAVREIIAAFEQRPASRSSSSSIRAGRAAGQDRGGARRRASRPTSPSAYRQSHVSPQWAFEDRLVDLTDAVGHFWTCSIRTRSTWSTLLNAKTGQRASTRCRWAARPTTSTSGRASWSRRASPSTTSRKEWEAFWSFWCDQVQPAVRKATGRDDIWGVGLHVGRGRRHRRSSSSSSCCLRGGLRDPRRPARHRRPGVRRQAGQGARQLHRRSTARAAPRPTR